MILRILAELGMGILLAAWFGLVVWGGSIAWDCLAHISGPGAFAARLTLVALAAALIMIPLMMITEWSVGQEMVRKAELEEKMRGIKGKASS